MVSLTVITLAVGPSSSGGRTQALPNELSPLVRLAVLVTDGRQEALAPVSRFVCSGYLYRNVFVTAEHCLTDVEPSQSISIAFGSNDLCRTAGWEYVRGVVERTWQSTDVAIAKVGGSVGDPEFDLDWVVTGHPERQDREFIVAGWQASDRPGVVGCRSTTSVVGACTTTGSFAECEVEAGQSVCVGMSGAPVLTTDGDLVGLLSASTSCSGGRAWFGLGHPVLRGDRHANIE